MSENIDFEKVLHGIKIPVLILDQKWHRLFALGGKTPEVQELENVESGLLKKEAELKKELKDLKKVRETLMSSVMSNMEGTSDLVSKKLDEDKRLLEECKARIKKAEDELLDLPNQLDEANRNLMLLTMEYSYDKLRTNSKEAEEITNWIKNIRVQLKKNVIRKNNREINNKEIYSYMHDVFGMEVLNIFDLENGDFSLGFLDDHSEVNESENASNDNSLKKINLEEVNLDEVAKDDLSSQNEETDSIE